MNDDARMIVDIGGQRRRTGDELRLDGTKAVVSRRRLKQGGCPLQQRQRRHGRAQEEGEGAAGSRRTADRVQQWCPAVIWVAQRDDPRVHRERW